MSGQGQLFLIPPFVHARVFSEEAQRELAAALQDQNPALAPRRAPGTPLPPPCPQPRHGSGPFPGTGSAASLCFLSEIAQRGDFTPPRLPGAGVSAAIHHRSCREVSGTISEPVVLTLSETICFLMKLVEEKKRVLTTDVLFHLQFTGACIFHSWKWLIFRFIQSGAGTALDGSILAARLGQRDLAEHTAVQGSSQSQPQILCPRWAKRPIFFFFFPNPCSSALILFPFWARRDFH